MKKIIRATQIIPWLMLVSILCCTVAWGQGNSRKGKRVFLRIYDKQGKIIIKGKLANLSDSTIVLFKAEGGSYRFDSVHYSRIFFIRKGRSPMHYFLLSGLIGFAVTVPVVAATEVNKAMTSVASNALALAIAGTPIPEEPSHAIRNGLIAGTIVGGISALAHLGNQRKIQVDRSFEKFNSAKQLIRYYETNRD
ncbi:MAG: hypothetical protein AABY93_00335 [Bacteroidota bacterium]